MRDDDIRRITDGLKWLVLKLEGRSVARLYDLHVVSEDSIKDMLNCIRGLNLLNLNDGAKNFPAIDLGDKTKRLSFQITTDKSAGKVQSSLDKFHKHNLDKDYDQVIFLILGRKQRQYTTIRSSGISFVPSRDVVDIDDLIQEASALPSPKLTALVNCMNEAGLNVSGPEESDEKAFRKIHSHFDRDALAHIWQQEGSVGKFDVALSDLTELINKGTIQNIKITKPIYQFNDPSLTADLNAVKRAVSDLRARLNQHVRSGEIRLSDEFVFFKNPLSPEEINAAKRKVLNTINKIGDRYGLPRIVIRR